MASFTDAISQFNPYVAQLPVEAMKEVGMYKQAKYEEGVQKIQNEIDKVAGLDLIRDVDRQYLQSKLNQLGGRLKTVAGGDFSNFQLVNSVGGMAKQIGKDSNVQSAVASTAWYRKQAAEMEKAISEGKSSQANIWDFTEKANAWKSSTDIKQGFNGRYTQYIDVNKKFLDVLKSINPSATQEDIAYEIDPKTGKPNFNKIAAAMARKGYEGVTSDKIENALNATLTPDEINQLSIDARYTFRGYGVPELQNYTKQQVSAKTEMIDKQIEGLEKIAKMSSSSSTDVSVALQAIQDLKTKKLNIEKDLPSQLDEIARNPDALKFKIYKSGYLDSFSEAFSWEKQKLELLSNPVLAADHWEKDYKIAQEKLNLDKQQFTWKQYVDTEGLKFRQAELDVAVAKTFGGTGAFTTYLGEDTNVKNPMMAMKQDANQKDQQALGGIREMAVGLFGKATPENIGIVEKSIRDYQNATTTEERNKAVPVEWREVVNNVIENRIKANNIRGAITDAQNRVVNDPSLAGSAAAIDKAIQSKKGFTVTIGGKPTYFSNKEILDFLNKEQVTFATSGIVTGPDTGAQKAYKTINTDELSPKELALYNVIKGSRYGANTTAPTPGQGAITGIFNQYSDVLQQGKQYKNQVDQLVTNDLMQRSGKYIPSISPIFVGSSKDGDMARSRMESIVGAVLSRYSRDKGGAEGLDVSGASSILAGEGKGDIQYQKVIQGDKTYVVMKKGTEEYMIPLTAMEASALPKGKNEPSSLEVDITTVQQLNNGSTNPSGLAENSYFQSFNFNNVRGLNVTGDLRSNKSNPAIQYLDLKVKLPSGWKTLPLNDFPMDVSKAASMIGGFTDNEIKQLFLNSKSIPQSWKDEIKTIQ